MTRVLVVDDARLHRATLRMLLETRGCEVDEAGHGAEALVKARLAPPHLIISDLLMPVMDGYNLLSQWKADEQLRQIPFIVYTATYTGPQDRQLALVLGADAFVVKPDRPESFGSEILDLLEKWEHGELSPARVPQVGDLLRLKEYSEVIARKLEAKVLQLEEDIARRKEAEQKVNAQLDELRLWHRATMDREDRIREIKREVNELRKRLGEGVKYPSVETEPTSCQRSAATGAPVITDGGSTADAPSPPETPS